MSIPTSLTDLNGEWAGVNRLWLSPHEPARHSEGAASIGLTAQGRFATIRYTWAEGGRSQEGMLVVGMDEQQGAAEAFWVDSWHMVDKSMLCRGTLGSNGAISVQGSYPAPPGPDWGWRIVINPKATDGLRITMYNISPDGQEDLAVEAEYSRRS